MAELLYARLDLSGLNDALSRAQRFSKRTPGVAANTAAFFVMRGWVRDVRKVPIGTIDTELGSATVLVRKQRGSGYRRARRTRQMTGGRMGTEVTTVPLVLLIVLARANLAGLNRKLGTGKVSNYNITTGNRYALMRKPTKAEYPGVVSRMIKGRHSAAAFLAASGLPIIRDLERVIDARYRRGAPPRDRDVETAARHSLVDKATVAPAPAEGEIAFCYAELLLGMAGKNAESINRALHQIGGPELQRQLNLEAEKTFLKVAEWEAAEMEKDLRAAGAIR